MCAAGWCSMQPQSTVLMAYQPGASGVPAFSPTVSPGCVTDPARAGTAVQSDRAPAAANFVHLLFICNSHRPPGAVSVADRSAEPHLVYGPRCFCPMVTRSRQLPPRTFLFWALMVLPILIGTSGNVAAGTHMPQHKRSTARSIGFRSRSSAAARLCSWSARSSRTIPREDFSRVAESLEATHEMLVRRHGRRHGTGLARHIARRRSALPRLAVQSNQSAGNLRCRRVDRAV